MKNIFRSMGEFNSVKRESELIDTHLYYRFLLDLLFIFRILNIYYLLALF